MSDNIHPVVELLLVCVNFDCGFIPNLFGYGIILEELKVKKFFQQLLDLLRVLERPQQMKHLYKKYYFRKICILPPTEINELDIF